AGSSIADSRPRVTWPMMFPLRSSPDTVRKWTHPSAGCAISGPRSGSRTRRASGPGRRCRWARIAPNGGEMDFRLTPEQEQFRDSVLRFARKALADKALERAHASGYPWDVAKLM